MSAIRRPTDAFGHWHCVGGFLGRDPDTISPLEQLKAETSATDVSAKRGLSADGLVGVSRIGCRSCSGSKRFR